MKSIFDKIKKDEIKDEDIIEYIKYLVMEKKLSENSSYSYYNDLLKASNYFKKDLRLIETKDIKKYINSLNESDRSVAHTITALRSFYKFLIINKKVQNNPMNLIKPPKLSKKIPKVLNVDEIDKLLNIKLENEFDYRNKAMLELMYACGLRVSEIVDLKLTDIDLVNSIVKVFGKGSKERIIPIGEYANAALGIYINHYRDLLLKNKISDFSFIYTEDKNRRVKQCL